ncbi:Txe/YoeB family addiction module toxin [Cyanobium sp. ULC084]
MRLIVAPKAWQDYLHWQEHDRKMQQRINHLIEAIRREPFSGIGKAEPLKHSLAVAANRWRTLDRLPHRSAESSDRSAALLRYHY